jgi:hypothetical protein
MPYDASIGFGVAADGHRRHDRHQDHPCRRGHQDHQDEEHLRQERTVEGTTHRRDATGCNRDASQERLGRHQDGLPRQHRLQGRQDDRHRDRQDDQDLQDDQGP